MKGGPWRLTASGVVGVSGRPMRVYGVTIQSGATASVISLRDGTGASDTANMPSISGNSNESKNVPGFPAEGCLFPSGCYCTFDSGDTTSVVVYAEAQ